MTELPAEARTLVAWAAVDRDALIRATHAAGVSKHRIYTLTGIARTTIDRALARGQGSLAPGPIEEYERAGVIVRGSS